ncbi:hypothetical protein BGZ63DRAFT_445674 [Mariannaea sp. PMI_226]|nr:hypothetical protein BGZ63DRAFT_445674 [Mariannaea sp. PMI_226]
MVGGLSHTNMLPRMRDAPPWANRIGADGLTRGGLLLHHPTLTIIMVIFGGLTSNSNERNLPIHGVIVLVPIPLAGTVKISTNSHKISMGLLALAQDSAADHFLLRLVDEVSDLLNSHDIWGGGAGAASARRVLHKRSCAEFVEILRVHRTRNAKARAAKQGVCRPPQGFT